MFLLRAGKARRGGGSQVTRLAGRYDIPIPTWRSKLTSRLPRSIEREIYAALGVAEVWRFADSALVIERLTAQGAYVSVEKSEFLPVRADEIRRWVVDEDSADDSAWARRLRAELKSTKVSNPGTQEVGSGTKLGRNRSRREPFMSTATTQSTTVVPTSIEVPGPVPRVPDARGARAADGALPERRVVYRGVDWSF